MKTTMYEVNLKSYNKELKRLKEEKQRFLFYLISQLIEIKQL